ncbi:hypothetical protein GCM10009716_40380 [Streptomyces sodiiphilus]|uniref:Fluoride-specific ion channel FluC n=1 Tax=Streptomyces sodiiphilus TaxID=226217 RepID=A0ABN2PQ19_9ACTN
MRGIPGSGPVPEPIDPDVDLSSPAQRRERERLRVSVLAAVAAGGALGAAARYAAFGLWPHPPGGFPWATVGVNVAGCALIGVLMVLVGEAGRAHPLVRPFLGTGVLGGFTTFSHYALDIQRLLEAGRLPAGLGYLAVTLLGALAAVWCAAALTRRAVRRPRRGGGGAREAER